MTQSFFSLTPDNDHPHGPLICTDCAAEMAAEPEAEREANMQAAITLGNSLLDALDTYTDMHEDTTYRHIFEGLAYMQWQLQRERDEDEDETHEESHISTSSLPLRSAPSQDDHPGISADEETWHALCEALRETLNDCKDRYPDLTWGDVIHAAKYLVQDLIQSYHDDISDA